MDNKERMGGTFIGRCYFNHRSYLDGGRGASAQAEDHEEPREVQPPTDQRTVAGDPA